MDRTHLFESLLTLLVFFVSHSKSEAFSYQSGPNDLIDPLNDRRNAYAVIQTKQGLVRGLVINSTANVEETPRQTTRFFGVPYATPPTGDLRFRKPRKHPGWAFAGTLHATEARPACPQFAEDAPDSKPLVGISEDCLYLNIYIPTDLSAEASINTLSFAVMVFIHGGDFKRGKNGLHPAWHLAEHGDVIIVEVQYRLGVLGFLSTLGEDAPGNLGLLDQKRALQWIWDNIREFGGDPERITIFGEGAGGVSVGFHVLSPHSRGFIIRAISQGGTALSPGYLQRQPVAMATALSQSNFCPVDNHAVMIECLRMLPVETLLESSRRLEEELSESWLPVVDGDFLLEEPAVLISEGRYNLVDYVIGVNSDAGFSDHLPFDIDFQHGISEDAFRSVVEDAVERTYGHYYGLNNLEEAVSAVMHEYTFCGYNGLELTKLIVEFLGDVTYLAPALRVVSHLAQSDRKVYFYTFSQPSAHDSDVPDFIKSAQGDELRYLFHEQTLSISEKDEQVAVAMKDAWTNFAKTGDPNPVNDRGVNWRQYRTSLTHQVDFRMPLDSSANRLQTKPRRVSFWNAYLPHIMAEYRTKCNGQTKEECTQQLQSVQADQVKTSLSLWIALGVCALLAVTIGVLTIKQCVPNATKRCTCQCCEASEQTQAKYMTSTYLGASEMMSLRPLPYRDET